MKVNRNTTETFPLVSVILPTFQRAHLLPRSIASVVSQTLTNWELLIIDDGSTDNTRQVVSPWCVQSPRIHYIPQPHRGVSAARNRGIAAARGPYIACLDSDDEYHATHLATRLKLLRENRLDLIQGGFHVLGRPWVVDFFLPTELIHLDACVVGGTLFGRREVFTELGGFHHVSYGEDCEFWLRAQQRFKVATFKTPVTYSLYETPHSLRLREVDEWTRRDKSAKEERS